MRPIANLHILENEWKQTGSDEDPMSRLLSTVCINGVSHHLEAFQVVLNDQGDQTTADEGFSEILDGMASVSTPDGSYQTVEIFGRDYVLCMTPYC